MMHVLQRCTYYFLNAVILFIVKRYYTNRQLSARIALGLTAFLMLLAGISGAQAAGVWTPLAKDDLHDPKGPAITLLQEPADGLNALPPDKAGNMVDWVQAMTKGVINPRRTKSQLGDGAPFPPIQPEIMMDKNGSMPMVLFPHKVHTLWLDCSNCHPSLFEAKIGVNNLSMERILGGEQCGLCHGAVAFPPTNCSRCHSVKH